MLGRLMNPLFGLLSLVVLYTANSVASGIDGEFPSGGAYFVYVFGFTLFLTWWVYLDRHKRRYSAPFEFEAFVFFAWIVVVPYYLIQTRHWRGLPLIGALYLSFFLPNLVIIGMYGSLRLFGF